VPVTAVGKIFKPALKEIEMEATIRAEAKTVGATIGELRIDRDSRIGTIARVRVLENPHALREALDRYTFRWEIA
jgi:fatty-acyl-CoA synthase